MKLIDLTCNHCGAQMKVDSAARQVLCDHCGARVLIDDEVRRIEPNEFTYLCILFSTCIQRLLYIKNYIFSTVFVLQFYPKPQFFLLNNRKRGSCFMSFLFVIYT